MKPVFLLLCLAGPAWGCIPPELDGPAYDVSGEAVDTEDRLLYRERLRLAPGDDGGVLKVSYTRPDGTLLANKVVNYRCQPLTPSYEMTGVEGELLESVDWSDTGIVATRGQASEQLAPPDRPAIVDAGFDNAIRLHWNELLSGEALDFDYFFARDGRFVRLRFARHDNPPTTFDADDPGLVHFRITAANPLLRLFASAIQVGYTQPDRRLRYYAGPSNLPMMDDAGQVLIRYTHAGESSG